jgi:hypothetical protein
MEFGVARQTNSTNRRFRIRRAALGREQHARSSGAVLRARANMGHVRLTPTSRSRAAPCRFS